MANENIFDLTGTFNYESPFGNWEKKDFSKSKLDELTSSSSNINQNVSEIALNEITGKLKIGKADGYYYQEDGTFIGKHGTSKLINICSSYEEIGDNIRYHIKYRTKIKYSDLILVAGAALAESSYGYGVENKLEVFAIANAIMNYYYYEYEGTGTIKSSMAKQKIYATTDGNPTFKKFNKYTDKQRNYNFSKEGIRAALNALHEKSCTDYSNGATHWDGIDAKKAKWSQGMKFQEKSADIFGLGDNKKPVKQKYKDGKCYERIYDYKWIGTKGFSGTNPKKKNPYHPYYEGDTINEHKFGTILMRLSKEYKTRLKYGDKKVE